MCACHCRFGRKAITATAFADILQAAREPGTSRLSASGIADMLGLQQQELAVLAGVHRNTLRTHPNRPGCKPRCAT